MTLRDKILQQRLNTRQQKIHFMQTDKEYIAANDNYKMLRNLALPANASPLTHAALNSTNKAVKEAKSILDAILNRNFQ